MKTLILTIAMNAALALPLAGQNASEFHRTANWLDAARQCLGQQASAGWLMDLEADGAEILVSADRTLLIVDHEPIVTTSDGRAFLRAGIHGLAGTQLTLQGNVDAVNDSVLHGTYTGTLGGSRVIMDQYLKERNGVPLMLVRVIRGVQGSAPVLGGAEAALALTLLESPYTLAEPMLSQQ